MSNLLCLIFHSIDKDTLAHRYSISEAMFSDFLGIIKKNNYMSIDTRNLNQSQDGTAIHISFDDGAISDFEIAATLLLKHKLKATFFITTNYIGIAGYMNWEQVKGLKQMGFDIQSHTHGHRLLATLNKKEIEQDLRMAKDTIEQKLGGPVEALSLPGGSMNKEVIEVALSTGHKYIFTSIPKINNFSQGNVFHRMLVKHSTSLADFEKILIMDEYYFKKEQAKYGLRKAIKNVLGANTYLNLWKKLYKNRVSR